MKRNTQKFILGVGLILAGLALIVRYDGQYWPVEAGTILLGFVIALPRPFRWTV